MTRNIFLIFLAVAFVCTEGHESENRRLVSASNGFRDAEDKLFSSHDKVKLFLDLFRAKNAIFGLP